MSRYGVELATLYPLSAEDTRCAEVFGWTHDLGRIDDGTDRDHPVRGADLFRQQVHAYFTDLAPRQREIIEAAIRYHSAGGTAEQILGAGYLDHIVYDEDRLMAIMGCCWDADRFGLLRLNMTVNERYMQKL